MIIGCTYFNLDTCPPIFSLHLNLSSKVSSPFEIVRIPSFINFIKVDFLSISRREKIDEMYLMDFDHSSLTSWQMEWVIRERMTLPMRH